jgi:hypothetical protein
MHRPTDKTEVSALYEREVSVRCDREDVCKQREDICRHRSGNSQITEVGALFNRAVSVLRCECALTATETLRGEGMRANSGGIYVETTFRECTDSDS